MRRHRSLQKEQVKVNTYPGNTISTIWDEGTTFIKEYDVGSIIGCDRYDCLEIVILKYKRKMRERESKETCQGFSEEF